MKKHTKNLATRQRGFTLLVVLFLVVVLLFFFFGFVGFLFFGQRNNHSAYLRSQATALAYDMIDRMRANQAGVTSGAYNAINTTTNTYANPGCITSGCSTAQMAQYDMYEWQTQLTARLPSGNGTVAGNGAGTSFTVTVMWDDDRNGSGSTTCGSGAMKCFSVSSTQRRILHPNTQRITASRV